VVVKEVNGLLGTSSSKYLLNVRHEVNNGVGECKKNRKK
jgi:hypothetical protein